MRLWIFIGAATRTATVEVGATHIQSDTGEISDVISGQQVSRLETNGQSLYPQVNLTPGATSVQGGYKALTPVGGNANVSFNGHRKGRNIYLIEGGEDPDRGSAGTFSVMPSLATTVSIVAPSLTGLDQANYKLPATYQYNLPPTADTPGLVSGALTYNSAVPHLGFNFIKQAEDEADGQYNSPQLDICRHAQNITVKSVLELAGISMFKSGSLRNVNLSGAWGSNGVQYATNRPNLTGAISYPKQRLTNGNIHWFGASAFSQPTRGAWGNLGNNALQGPGRGEGNLALYKIFSITEHSSFEFRTETVNLWNHT